MTEDYFMKFPKSRFLYKLRTSGSVRFLRVTVKEKLKAFIIPNNQGQNQRRPTIILGNP